MERESFEDYEAAEKLNKDFIAVKVDREERPDIDSVYMSACQAMTGSGGWPLTVLMTPDRKPFYAATYLPKRTRRNIIGLMELLDAVSEKWKAGREEVEIFSERLSEALKSRSAPAGQAEAYDTLVMRAYRVLSDSFDERFGGFGGAPKFPTPHNIMFLLKHYEIDPESATWQMIDRTLTGMYRGGIFDHIGFGFSRYSTDRRWLAPHFEKMLYDNALLIMAYATAYGASGNELFKSVAQKND